jgi:5'-3' exonuclease
MGIPQLNKFLKGNCPNSIEKIGLHELRDKKIVIDAYNYLYRFVSDGTLLESFYLLISILRENNIIPIFIFDGKNPVEKKEILTMRKKSKKCAQDQYTQLKDKYYNTTDITCEEKAEIATHMISLKKKFLSPKKNDIKLVKMLIKSYGVAYYDAEGEADVLCATLVSKNIAYACMSDDMDMFVYGCPRVLRYLSLTQNTIIMYNFKNILLDLDVSKTEFKQICVLSGTDYNYGMYKNASLYKTLNLYKRYRQDSYNINNTKQSKNPKKTKNDFCEWLENNTSYIEDSIKLYNTLCIFSNDYSTIYNKINKINKKSLVNGPIVKELLHAIMKKDGFIFMNK